MPTDTHPTPAPSDLPVVSAVFLAFNRREQLRESLRHMREESGYPPESLELIVVDNASQDGTADMVRADFPDVTVIESPANIGAPAWNAGFRVARGEYVLILDDDAYMTPGALTAAVRGAQQADAGLVSFTVISSFVPSYRFNDEYRTGLLSYWGCAALVSRAALDVVHGYDPNIFIWGNELEFTIRLLDAGFTHLYLPEVVAVHMKEPDDPTVFKPKNLRNNFRHWGYVAGKLLRPADAVQALGALAASALIESVARDRRTAIGFVPAFAGFLDGLRHRAPVRPVVSRTYRRNFRNFDWPWRYWRGPRERWAGRRTGLSAADQRSGRQEPFFERRERYYPERRASLSL